MSKLKSESPSWEGSQQVSRNWPLWGTGKSSWELPGAVFSLRGLPLGKSPDPFVDGLKHRSHGQNLAPRGWERN